MKKKREILEMSLTLLRTPYSSTPQANGAIKYASMCLNRYEHRCEGLRGVFFGFQKCRKFDVLGRVTLGGEMISCYEQLLVFSTVAVLPGPAVDRESSMALLHIDFEC